MSVEGLSWLDLLNRYCRQHELALLLTATHTAPGFATPSRSVLKNLDVIEVGYRHGGILAGPDQRSRRELIRAGELCIRADLEMVDGDLEAAAELLVGLLTRSKRMAA